MSPALRGVYFRKYPTIRKFAEALLRFVNSQDEDGRDRGLDYDTIQRIIIRKFPVVLYNGRHKGEPTRMSRRELYEVARILKLAGERLPPRFTSKRKTDKAR
jgi:hypothetical protein